MKSFDRFLTVLAAIPDPRRAEGKRYEQRHVLQFSILAIVAGADSYRGIHTFIRPALAKAGDASATFEQGLRAVMEESAGPYLDPLPRLREGRLF